MLAAALLSGGCARGPGRMAPETRPPALVSKFSSVPPGSAYPAGWRELAFSRFRKPTRYAMVDDCGTTVVEASAEGGSSGLVEVLDVDPRKYPVLMWQWKVPEMIPGADNTRADAEDAPARVELSFAGNTKKIPIQDRVFFTLVKTLSGLDMPYATLEYVWGNGAPRETVITNTWTSRIRMILVESGRDRTGEWVREERNVNEDYRRAFGEEPGRITAIAINTDSDATGEKVHAYYGDIAFLPEGSAGGELAALASPPGDTRPTAHRPQSLGCPAQGK